MSIKATQLTQGTVHVNLKQEGLERTTEKGLDQFLNTKYGSKKNDGQHALKAGAFGLGLPVNILLREKITHFAQEEFLKLWPIQADLLIKNIPGTGNYPTLF